MTASWSFEQLLAPVLKVVHRVARLGLDKVFLPGGRHIQQHHAAADPLLEVDVLLQLHVGPEVHQLDALVGGANAVDPAEALDDANRVPVDVVVDQLVAVLEVLTFGDAVGGDEQVDFAFAGQVGRPLLGPRRERREDAGEVSCACRAGRLVADRPVTKRRLDAEGAPCPRGPGSRRGTWRCRRKR